MLVDIDQASFVAGSFRDRTGRVFLRGDRVFRTLSAEGLSEWQKVSRTNFFRDAAANGSIVGTVLSDDASVPDQSDSVSAVLEHDRIEMLTWPWEWSFSMLRDAALSQLDLLQAALREHCILKDSTPFNWQFHRGHWTLMDVGSLTPLRPGQVWEGYRQFCEMFLFP